MLHRHTVPEERPPGNGPGGLVAAGLGLEAAAAEEAEQREDEHDDQDDHEQAH